MRQFCRVIDLPEEQAQILLRIDENEHDGYDLLISSDLPIALMTLHYPFTTRAEATSRMNQFDLEMAQRYHKELVYYCERIIKGGYDSYGAFLDNPFGLPDHPFNLPDYE